LRTEQDCIQAWPAWFIALARRIAALERGKAYDVLLILPDDEGAPSWAVQARGKVESGRK
jgi:hypothetical protein